MGNCNNKTQNPTEDKVLEIEKGYETKQKEKQENEKEKKDKLEKEIS